MHDPSCPPSIKATSKNQNIYKLEWGKKQLNFVSREGNELGVDFDNEKTELVFKFSSVKLENGKLYFSLELYDFHKIFVMMLLKSNYYEKKRKIHEFFTMVLKDAEEEEAEELAEAEAEAAAENAADEAVSKALADKIMADQKEMSKPNFFSHLIFKFKSVSFSIPI